MHGVFFFCMREPSRIGTCTTLWNSIFWADCGRVQDCFVIKEPPEDCERPVEICEGNSGMKFTVEVQNSVAQSRQSCGGGVGRLGDSCGRVLGVFMCAIAALLLQAFMHKVLEEDDPIAAQYSLIVMIDLYRRQIWTDDHMGVPRGPSVAVRCRA